MTPVFSGASGTCHCAVSLWCISLVTDKYTHVSPNFFTLGVTELPLVSLVNADLLLIAFYYHAAEENEVLMLYIVVRTEFNSIPLSMMSAS